MHTEYISLNPKIYVVCQAVMMLGYLAAVFVMIYHEAIHDFVHCWSEYAIEHQIIL